MQRLAWFALLFLPLSVAAAVDPAAAVQRARALVAAGEYARAVDALKGALEAAASLQEPERTQASAAIHFYSAAALSGAGAGSEARAHLAEYFKLAPNARLTAPEKYDARFVKLFDEVRPRDPQAELRFDHFYPGFASFPAQAGGDPSIETSAGIEILGSREEKREWNDVMPSADRAKFIEEFWKRRDPDAATPENEFRETFRRRVAFANRVFDAADNRGSLTDRGRVFVLLGAPAAVRRRPLTRRDRIVTYDDTTVINGSVEEWVYAAEQLPIRMKKRSVSLRFVTQRGIGDGVLQREDIYALNALMTAMNPNEKP